jgi:uncharacterized membrane protein YkgB
MARANTASHKQAFLTLVRHLAGAILLGAGIAKGFDYHGLLIALLRLHWLDNAAIEPVADLLLAAELTTGVLLIANREIRLAGILGATMSVVFLIVTCVKLLEGATEGCDCFGVFLSLTPPMMLLVDTVLLSACLVVIHTTRTADHQAGQ